MNHTKGEYMSEKIVIQQEEIDSFEKQAEVFCQKIFNQSSHSFVMTDISQLSDFSGCNMPEDLSQVVDKEVAEQELPTMNKSEKWKLFSRIYNRHWDKWILNKIQEELEIVVSIDILMVDLFVKMYEKEQENKVRTTLH